MDNNFNELHFIIESLNDAILSHHEWAGKLIALKLLDTDSINAILDKNAHKKCTSHKLIEAIGDKLIFSETKLLNNILHAHQLMHDKARELVLSNNNGNLTKEVLETYIHSQQAFVTSIELLKNRLSTLINTADPLTGLPTRPSLQLHLRDIYDSQPDNLYLVIIDLDHFKVVNDTYGHNTGDEILRTFALSMQTKIRSTEKLYRYGGEEFIMFIYANSKSAAGCAGSRMCKNIRETKFQHADNKIDITATIGITKYNYNVSFEDNLEIADQALYHGKSDGRNRCIIDDGLGGYTDYSTVCDN